MLPFGAPGKPQRQKRHHAPLRKRRKPGAKTRQGRHDVAIGPGVPNFDVQPFAENRVGQRQDHGCKRNATRTNARPILWPEEGKGNEKRKGPDQDIA